MKRIEFILDEYGPNTPTSAKLLLKEFFDGLEWCTEREDLVARLLNKAEPATKKPGKKNEPADPRLVIEGNVLLKFDPSRPAGNSPEFVRIPEGIVEIGCGAFANLGKAGIKTLFLPKSVKVIGRQAFLGVKQGGIEAIEIPADSQLERIEDGAFEQSEFDHVELPDGLLAIGNYAFYAAERLQYLYVPKSVEMIGLGAFARYYEEGDRLPRFHVRFGKTKLGVKKGLFRKEYRCPAGYDESCLFTIPLVGLLDYEKNIRRLDTHAVANSARAVWVTHREFMTHDESVRGCDKITSVEWGVERK